MATHISIQNRHGLYVVRSPAKIPGASATSASFLDPSAARAHAEAEARAHEALGASDVERDFERGEWQGSGSNAGIWIMGVLSAAALGALGWFGYKKYAATSMSKLMPVDPLTPIVSDVTATYKDKNGLPWAVRGTYAGTGLGKLYNWSVRYKGDNNPVYPAKSLEWKDVGSTAMDAEMGLAACKRWIDSEVASYMKDAEGDLFG